MTAIDQPKAHHHCVGVGPTAKAGAAALITAGVAIALKLPQAAISLAVPAGIEGLTPQVTSYVGVVVTLAWVGFSLALLALRKWLGALSSAWFCVVSLLSGGRLLVLGFTIWGGWQLITAVVAIIAIIVAVTQGAFKSSRW